MEKAEPIEQAMIVSITAYKWRLRRENLPGLGGRARVSPHSPRAGLRAHHHAESTVVPRLGRHGAQRDASRVEPVERRVVGVGVAVADEGPAQQPHTDAPVRAGGKTPLVGLRVGGQGHGPLAQVGLAGHGPRLIPRPVQRRDQDRHQQRDHRNDHQQFDQGEGVAASPFVTLSEQRSRKVWP